MLRVVPDHAVDFLECIDRHLSPIFPGFGVDIRDIRHPRRLLLVRFGFRVLFRDMPGQHGDRQIECFSLFRQCCCAYLLLEKLHIIDLGECWVLPRDEVRILRKAIWTHLRRDRFELIEQVDLLMEENEEPDMFGIWGDSEVFGHTFAVHIARIAGESPLEILQLFQARESGFIRSIRLYDLCFLHVVLHFRYRGVLTGKSTIGSLHDTYH